MNGRTRLDLVARAYPLCGDDLLRAEVRRSKKQAELPTRVLGRFEITGARLKGFLKTHNQN